MVRLKALKELKNWRNKKISIPYGAIKSLTDAGSTTEAKGFQFLMVRLKEIMNLKYLLMSISIPYGAIKSILIALVLILKYMISIPYGAIKRNLKVVTKLHIKNFNSLWCD